MFGTVVHDCIRGLVMLGQPGKFQVVLWLATNCSRQGVWSSLQKLDSHQRKGKF